MPQFSWTAHDAHGNALTGTIEAASKEQVIVKLRGSGVIADEVRETGVTVSASGEVLPRDYKRTFKLALLAVLTITGAAAMTLISPIDIIRCAPDRSCAIEHRLAGLYAFDKEAASNLTAADVTRDTANRYSKYAVAISGPGGKITTFPKSTSIPSDEILKKSVEQFLAAPNGRSYFMLQTEVIVVIPVLLILLAVHFVRLAFR